MGRDYYTTMSTGRKPSAFKCPQTTCKVFQSVAQHSQLRKNAAEVQLTEDDMNHLRDDHLRIWGDLGWARAELEVEKRKKSEGDIMVFKAQINKLTVKAPTPKQLTPVDLVVDPKNHADGICDHLMSSGNGIYKCTDYVRHSKKVCGMHLESKTLVKN